MSSGKITRFQNNVRVDGDLDLSNSTGNLTLSSLSSAPSSPTVGDTFYDSTLQKARIYQDSGWSVMDGTAAGSLDAAYNGGGTIAVDGAPVTLNDTITTTGALLITSSGVIASSTTANILYVNSTGAHSTTGRVTLLNLNMGAETATTPEGARITMQTNTDNALKIVKGAITVDDGALTLTSGALTLTSGNLDVSGTVTSGGTLICSGAATVATTLVVTGNTTAGGTLTVDTDNAAAFLVQEEGATAVLTVDTTQDAGDTSMLLTTAVTTGTGFHIDGSTITTGDALKVTVAASTMGATGAAISVVADGSEVFAVRDDGSVLSVTGTAEGTTALGVTAGDVLITDGDLTVSGGETSLTDGVTTAGSGLLLTSSMTTAGAAAGGAGALTIVADSATTGTVLAINAEAITSGDIIYLNAGAGTLSGGFYINCNDDNSSDFTVGNHGATVITGSASGTAALTLTAGDITLTSGSVAMTDTNADQFAILYDSSNHFGIDVDVDGSTTLTTTGTNADLDLVSGTTGDITLTSTLDIILAATGGDVNSNAPVNITVAAGSQLELIGSGSIKCVDSCVDTTGVTTRTVSGGSTNSYEIDAGVIILDSAAAITLESTGVTSNAEVVITQAAGSQLELVAAGSIKCVDSVANTSGDTTRTVSGGSTNIYEIVADTIVLDSAGDITLQAAGADITMDAQLSITNTSADQLAVLYDGSNHFAVDVDVDGSTTLTTTGTNADFLIASGTAGDITLDSTADIILEAGGADITADAKLTITTSTNATSFAIVDNTISTTGPLMDISSTSISTASMLKLNANTAANDGTVLEIISAGDTDSTPTGISVTAAAVTTGIAKGIAVSMALASTQSKGISVSMPAVSTGDMLYLDQSASDTMTAGSGYYINCNRNDSSDFSVSKYGATVIAGNAEGTAALTLTAGDAVITDGDLTVSGGEVSFTSNSTTAGLTALNNTFTTGAAFVDISSTSITTGALMRLGANCATHSGEVLELISLAPAAGTATGLSVTMDSVTTGAATGIAVTMVAATTTAKGIAVTMDGLTTGDMLYLDNGDDGMTGDGKFINCNEDNVSKFSVAADGNTTIAGTAAATAALTVSLGDLVITDTDASTISSVDSAVTMLTLDNAGGAVGSGLAVLKVDAGGVVDAAGYGILATFSGSAAAGATVVGIIPDAGSVGLKVAAGGVVTAEALYVDADPTANSVAYMHTDAVIAADKAVLELHCDTGESNADSSVLRIDQANLTGASFGITIVQADLDVPFINFEGTASADELSPISSLNTGTVTDYVRCAINGALAWVPVVTGALS